MSNKSWLELPLEAFFYGTLQRFVCALTFDCLIRFMFSDSLAYAAVWTDLISTGF